MYTEALWNDWVKKVENGFEVKSYVHFDPVFNFPKRKQEIKTLVSDKTALSRHPFLPFLKVNIKTPRFRYQEALRMFGLETKTRPISFSAHFDSYIYAFYSFVLTRQYEDFIRAAGFHDCVLAYRTDLDGKCNIQFSKEVFTYIKTRGNCTAIALDIKGYFDSIDHGTLKQKWCKVLNVPELPEDQYAIFRSLTNYAYINKNAFLRHFDLQLDKIRRQPTLLDYIKGKNLREKFDLLRKDNLIVVNKAHDTDGNGKKRFFGIPQGSALSATLSNIFLIDFDQWLHSRSVAEGFLYRRYCDDILIVCDTAQSFTLLRDISDEIQKYHLHIQSKKTELIEFCKNSRGLFRAFNLDKIRTETPSTIHKHNEGLYYKSLQYLGFEFNGQDIRIRSSSVSRYYRKMKARIYRTVAMASSRNAKGSKIFRQKLLHRYTHLGKRNFLKYGYNAASDLYKNSRGVMKEGMNAKSIRKQLAKHYKILETTLNNKAQSVMFKKHYK